MEIQIKKAVKAGNSSAVVLPRAWLNKEVRVELVKKTNDIILHETLTLVKKHIEMDRIIGIYLVGSYARGEEDQYSDIDVLIVTDKIDREMISEGIYNILIVSFALLGQKLRNDLLPVGQMIKEAKPLLNASYINSLNIEVTKENVDWYIKTTEEKIDLIEKIIDKMKKRNKKYLDDKIAYTLILRIRTLDIIEKLIENKNHSKKEFIKIINNLSGGKNSYERYLAAKNDSKENKGISIEEAERLHNYLCKQLIEIKRKLSQEK